MARVQHRTVCPAPPGQEPSGTGRGAPPRRGGDSAALLPSVRQVWGPPALMARGPSAFRAHPAPAARQMAVFRVLCRGRALHRPISQPWHVSPRACHHNPSLPHRARQGLPVRGRGQRQDWRPAWAPPRVPRSWCCGQGPPDPALWPCRAAVTMWRVMVVSSRTKKKVMTELCHVLKDWPFHRTSTSDGDNTDVFALAVSF